MAKDNRRGERQGRKARQSPPLPGDMLHVEPRQQRSRKPLEAQTRAQARYINAINVYDLIFCTGPAGTGKTYIAATMAADAMLAGDIKRIVITRPAVGADEEYGFFPGELEEKVAPWAAPVIRILEERLGATTVEYMLKAKKIEVAPLGLLRGHTFKDCFVIGDEMQNATVKQMKLFLSRIGENMKMIVDGDLEQKDIPGPSGLMDAIHRMDGHPQIGFVEFNVDDIVRSGLCRDILIRYAEKKGSAVGHAELGRILAPQPH